jgi:glycosyltransferase involved in cell wall biosynthesis
MTILMSSGDFYPNVGGVAAVVLELSRGLARRGNTVHVAHWLATRGDLPAEEEVDGVQIHRFVVPNYPAPLNRAVWLTRPRRLLDPLLQTIQPDVFHGHTFFPDGFMARGLRGSCATVFTNHTSQFLQALTSKRKRLEWSWLLRGFDLVLAPSQELVDRSTELGVEGARFISNAVDSRKFTPADTAQKSEARRELGLPADALIILAARRIETKNGLRYLAQAFAKMRDDIPNAVLVFCGPGQDPAEVAAVKAALAHAGGEHRVDFRGAVLNHLMPQFYRAADISVLPSLMEATSVSGLEAMASGLPLIGTNVGGIPQIITDGQTGLLVPARDADALKDALLALCRDPGARERLGRNAREAVTSRFDWDAISRETQDAYEATIAARGGTPAFTVR